MTTDVYASQSLTLAQTQDAADVRVTQSVTLALDDSPMMVDMYVSQSLALALYEETVDVHLSASLTLALTRELPELTQECQCWKVTRTDGVEYLLTTHDEPVVFKGETYSPCDSLSSTASRTSQSQTGAGDVTVRGVLTADGITAEDMAFGKFDNARVTVWVVQWGVDDLLGPIPSRIAQGILGTTEQGQTGFTAELRSPSARLLQQPLLHPFSPACRFKFGDAKCAKDLGPLQVSGTVSSVAPKLAFRRETYRTFTDSGRTEADRYFEAGNLTWVTGGNAGLTMEVSAYDAATKELTLWVPCPHEIQAGDTYTMTAGCLHTKAACIAHANYINFGGFPNIPGLDALASVPNAH